CRGRKRLWHDALVVSFAPRIDGRASAARHAGAAPASGSASAGHGHARIAAAARRRACASRAPVARGSTGSGRVAAGRSWGSCVSATCLRARATATTLRSDERGCFWAAAASRGEQTHRHGHAYTAEQRDGAEHTAWYG